MVGAPFPVPWSRKSADEGRTWSEPIVIDTLYDSAEQGYMMCRAIVCLEDGTLLVAADCAPEYTRPPGMPHNWKYDQRNEQGCEAHLYRSTDHGETWTGPERTGCQTISLTMKLIGTTLFLCGGPKQGEATHGLKAISRDGGDTWEGPYEAGKWPIVGRVAADRISSGDILVMHRVGGFALQHMYGFFLESAETALQPIEYGTCLDPPAGHRWGVIDNDTSTSADYGYGDWLELADGDVYAVNYTVDDAPDNCPQVRGYRLARDELAHPSRDLVIDFEPPQFARGKLSDPARLGQTAPRFVVHTRVGFGFSWPARQLRHRRYLGRSRLLWHGQHHGITQQGPR